MKIKKMQTRNKYAMMVNKYARVVETMMDDIFGFCIVNARLLVRGSHAHWDTPRGRYDEYSNKFSL